MEIIFSRNKEVEKNVLLFLFSHFWPEFETIQQQTRLGGPNDQC